MIGWPKSGVLLAVALVCTQGAAATEIPAAFAYMPAAQAPTADTARVLTLPEVMQLALMDQPLLTSREARIESEQQQAIVAAQLPDPKLTGGLKELPIDTSEAFSVRRDNFTEFTVGISQEFVRGEKRRLKSSRQTQAAETDRAALNNDTRTIRRDAALSWLEVYEAEQAMILTRHVVDEAQLQLQAVQTEYTAGKASQAEWFAAKIDAGLLADKAHDWLHHALKAREALARWIGDEAAQRPLAAAPTLPTLPATLPTMLARADQHPVVHGIDHQIEASATDIALAHQAYKTDFSVEVYTAYRPNYADFVGIQFTVGLPYFTKNRQDRELASALQQSRAAQEHKRDTLRELHAQVNQDYLDWQHYTERLADFDSSIIPDAQRRVDAARSSYGAGKASFDSVLLARRGQLDVQLQRLTLSVEVARAQVRLDYLTASQASGDTP